MLVLLLVDDHPVYLTGLQALLGQRLRQAQVLAAGSCQAALAQLRSRSDIDLVLADHRLPDGTGLGLLTEVARHWPAVGRLLMSGQDDPRLPQAARAAGAAGYIHKSTPPAQWFEALQAVLMGGTWFGGVPLAPAPAPLAGLPPRAREALALLARGLSNREIGQHMGIGERAVKQHLSTVFAVLGADSRVRAVVLARAAGLVPDDTDR